MHIISPIKQEEARATISEGLPALTVKSVPQRTGLLVPRTNLQPKCISALNILGCSESAFLAPPYKVFTLFLANRNFFLDLSSAVRRHDS